MRRKPESDRLTEEVSVLMHHAANLGIDAGEGNYDQLNAALLAYENAPDEEKAVRLGPLLDAYTALVRKTLPVSGHTILDTRGSRGTFRALLTITLCVLAVAVLNEGFAVWFSELPEPEEGTWRLLFQVRGSFLEFVSPFIWGALGACVYMMKRLYDIAAEQRFDREKLAGWTIRLLLGAILGAVAANIYDTSQLGEEAQTLSPDAFAFFAGLGVKVIYGAFERTVEILSEKMNLGAVRRGRPSTTEARATLAKKLSETDRAKDPARYDALVALIEETEREARGG